MLRPDEFYVQRMISDAGGVKEIDASIDLIKLWLKGDYWESKNKRIAEWNPGTDEIYEIVLAAFTCTLRFGKGGTTFQSLMGIMSGRFPHEAVLDRVKTAGEVIALIVKADLFNMWRTKSDKYYMVASKYELDTDIPEPDDFRIQMEPIPEFTTNKPAGYKALILGGKHNYHDEDICLDHINRMNAIPLKLNNELLRIYSEKPAFVFSDDPVKREKQQGQWKNFVHTSYRAYIQTVKAGNEFFLEHSYCKRGRTYARGYHISTQGSTFKKAIVQLAQTEPVKIERSTR